MKTISLLFLSSCFATSSFGSVITLFDEAASVPISGNNFDVFDNPFTDNASDPTDLNVSSGSLFFRSTITRTAGGYSVVGISASLDGNTDALTIGRDNANAGSAILDVINQNPFVRVPGGSVTIQTGTYTMIGEIEYTSTTETAPLTKIGTARAWIQNDASPISFSLGSPTVEVDLEKFFASGPDDLQIWRGANSNANATMANSRVHFVENSVDRSAAFAAAIPEPAAYGLLTSLLIAGIAVCRRRAHHKG